MRKCSVLFFLFLIFGMVWISGCKKSTKKQNGEADSLQVHLGVLNDSVSHAWQVMIDDDDEKLAYMKRLVQEISYTGNFDSSDYKNYIQEIDQLKSMRYTQVNLEEEGKIDNYDSATFALTRQISDYAESHPQFEDYGLMKELIQDINDKNGMILLFRVHYDGFVQERNAFIEVNKEKLNGDDARYNLQKLPVFQLSS